MFFVVDETSWDFYKIGSTKCVEALECLLDILNNALEEGHTVFYSEELFYFNVWPNLNFWELCFPDKPMPVSIPYEVQERITALFGGLPKWEESSQKIPATFEIEVDGLPSEYARSIAWAHKQMGNNLENSVGCLILPGGRQPAKLNVSVDGLEVPLWFIDKNEMYLAFFRWIIIETTKNPLQMENYLRSAFPFLCFIPNAVNGISHMSKPYNALIVKIVHNLGVLSDYGPIIFNGPWQNAPAEFASKGISVSDENGKTKNNKKAKEARKKDFNGTPFHFWWHCKLEPDRDRIHFKPNYNNNNLILVGIFHRHLPT